MMLVDFGYAWNESWTDRADRGKQTDTDDENVDVKWLYGILACAGGLYVASIAGVILMYSYYPTGDCSEVSFFISWTLVWIVLLTPLSLYREQLVGEAGGGILPVAVVAAYCTYLCWAALNSNPDGTCNPNYDAAKGPSTANIVVGIVVAAVSLMWTSYSASVNAGALFGKTEEATNEEKEQVYQLEDGQNHGATDDGGDDGQSLSRGPSKTSAHKSVENMTAGEKKDNGYGEPYWFFHLIMFTGSVYMAMLLTNWGAQENGLDKDVTGLGKASMWVKIISQWMTIALYVWTLVAPRCMPNREF